MCTDREQIDEFRTILSEEVTKWMDSVDVDSVTKVKELILDAESKGNRVHVTGIGKPGHVSGYAASLLSSVGTPAYELHGTEAVHGSSGQVLPGDVVIAISNSGETAELKATVTALRNNGAKVVALTGKPESWLAKECELALIAGVSREGDKLNKPPRASIIVEILMIQYLSILLQNERDLTPEEYVRWHPGGSLGKSILGH